MAINTNQMKNKATTFLADFSSGQKAVVIILVAILAVGGYGFMHWASAPSYAPLFGNLSANDASSITSELTSKHVPYQFSDGGKTIMVPSNQVDQLRIDMSAKGLPSGGDGWAIMDKQGITASDFLQQVDYQRALEAELAQTIEAINGVQAATVNLVVPSSDVFSDDTNKPSASILVTMANGTTLTSGQVQSIVNLTSSAVEGLSPNEVTVADSQGDLLNAPGQDGADAATDQQQQKTNAYESQLTSSLQQFLIPLVGEGHAVVRVSADLDFDDTQTQTQQYNPTGIKNPPAISQTQDQESYNGAGGAAVGGTLGGATGATGVTTSGSGNGTYTKNSNTSDFGVDQVLSTVNKAPGTVNKLSVSVIVDQSVKNVNTTALTSAVSAAVGLTPSRGDTISVSQMPFDTTASKAAAKQVAAAQSAKSMDQIIGLAKTLGTVILVALILFFAMRSARKRAAAISAGAVPVDLRELESMANRRASLQPGNNATIQLNSGGGANQRPLNVGDDTYDLDELGEVGRLGVTAEGAERIQLETQIGDLVNNQPDEVASLLRSWLADRRD